jgi:beta-glucanase (GH16 family)
MDVIFILFLLVSSTSAQLTHGQTRVLYETFDPPSLNSTIWSSGYPWGSYYNHRANITPRQAKITPDGYLNLTAVRERSLSLGLMTEFGSIDVDFTSGAINSNGKFCMKNGFIDIYLRVPDAESTWPSVFLVPEDGGRVPMLTVMEVFNTRSRYSYGFKYTNDRGEVEEQTFIADNRQTSDAFHRYGLDWGYDQITWYYDDKYVNTITKSEELKQVDSMCLVIALGVGGKSKDSPVTAQNYPAVMSVDLLEVWRPKYDGFYKFQNVQTGLLMEIDSAFSHWGARVLQWHDNGGDWQVKIVELTCWRTANFSAFQ